MDIEMKNRPLWSDETTEESMEAIYDKIMLRTAVFNLYQDIKCLKEDLSEALAKLAEMESHAAPSDKPAVAVPDEVRGAIERLDTTQYRVIARRYRAGEGHQSGYTGGNIPINDLSICVEYIRDLLSAAPSHSQQSAE